MLGYLSTDIICSERRTVSFLEGSSRKTVSFEEQIMSENKYPSTFSLQMEAVVFIASFSQRKQFWKLAEIFLKIFIEVEVGKYPPLATDTEGKRCFSIY